MLWAACEMILLAKIRLPYLLMKAAHVYFYSKFYSSQENQPFEIVVIDLFYQQLPYQHRYGSLDLVADVHVTNQGHGESEIIFNINILLQREMIHLMNQCMFFSTKWSQNNILS